MGERGRVSAPARRSFIWTLIMSRLIIALILVIIVAPARADGDFLGKRTADWIKELNDPKAEARRGAAFALGKCAAVEAVPHLVRVLGDKDAGVRDAAAYAVGEIVAESHVPGLWNAVGETLRKKLTEDDE